MKANQFIYSLFLFATLLLFQGCNDDEDPTPQNEEELITTVRLTFANGTDSFSAEWKDADGDGANPPVVDAITLEAGKTYEVEMEILNESESPAEDITQEIKEEDVDHQFFFEVSGGLALSVAYADEDANGHPVGLKTTFTAQTGSTGTLTVILRHQPDKSATGVAGGDITNAGGETDIETTPAFEVTIQ